LQQPLQASLRQWGEKLKRQHRPADLMALPKFMRPKQTSMPKPHVPPAEPKADTAPRGHLNQ